MLFACQDKQKEKGDEVGLLFPTPLTVELNTTDGYRINPVTGDSIQPIINSRGERVRTGVAVPASGLTIDPGKVSPPSVVPAGKAREVPGHLNERRIHTDLTIKAVQIVDLLEEASPRAKFPLPVLLNSTGDTLITGIPIPVEGSVVPCIFPQAVPTVPPGIKDEASMDIKYLDVYHGMISSQVISLAQDTQGNIWFGSTGGGAGRYDGRTLTHFGANEGLSESWITSILEDSQGRLWFGTLGEGVIRFNGENFTHFTEKEGLSNNTIETILEDSEGNLWFGTAGGGAIRYDGNAMTCFSMKEGLSNNWVLSIEEDQMGRLWFGTRRGVCRYQGDTFSYYREAGSMGDYPINSILEDGRGRLWFGTSGAGARMYNGETFTYFTGKEGFSNKNVESIVEDRHGNLWFGTTGDGAIMFRDNTFTHFTVDEGLSGTWIISILEDRSGNLWFGSVGSGVNILNGQSFNHFTDKNGLSSRAIYAIQEDRQGNLWFGTMFGGVNRYDGETFSHYAEKEGFNSNTVESILEDSQGNLWFGSGTGGVSRFDGNTFRYYSAASGFSNYSVGSMLEDRQGNIWFGTYGGGAIRYDGRSFTHFNEDGGLCSNLVEAIHEDRQGNLWIGTLGGVSLYDGKSFTHFSEKEGLSSNLIGSILQDSQGRLWFGTMTGGACSLSEGGITIYTKKEGLSDNHIQSMLEDSRGRIWLATEQGLNLMEFDSGAVKIHSFGLQDGLKGIHFLQNSALLDSKNRIWWGSNKSLTMLNMDAFAIAQTAPAIHLSQVDINGVNMEYRSLEDQRGTGVDLSSVAPFFNFPLNLDLSYNNNHLTFHFSALDWAAPHQVRYSYRMEGLNESWSKPSAEAKAEYRNLPYGTHTLEVRAIGEAQMWSEPLAYTFRIAPPWWHTWWARIAYVILLTLLMLSFVRWRTSRLHERQKELEHIVNQRTIEVSEMNEELKQQNQDLASQRQAITDSIEYARRIQTATLPPDEVLKYLFPKHFVLYRPLQIVSGDFYWLTQKREKIIVAVADCTGHGVPGAFMSMLGSALLNDIVNNMASLQANLILNELRDRVILSLRQTGEADEARDGMDIALCVVDREHMELQYAGAYNPLYHIREGVLSEVKADAMPIGISSEAGKSFTNHMLGLRKDDAIYMFSDGYADQVGGEKRKRFKTSRLKSLLLEVQDRIMFDQKAVLEGKLNEWMGRTGLYEKEYEQIDDVVVMGIKI